MGTRVWDGNKGMSVYEPVLLISWAWSSCRHDRHVVMVVPGVREITSEYCKRIFVSFSATTLHST